MGTGLAGQGSVQRETRVPGVGLRATISEELPADLPGHNPQPTTRKAGIVCNFAGSGRRAAGGGLYVALKRPAS